MQSLFLMCMLIECVGMIIIEGNNHGKLIYLFLPYFLRNSW